MLGRLLQAVQASAMRAGPAGYDGARQSEPTVPLDTGLFPARRCGAVDQLVAVGVKPQQQIAAPRQAGTAGGGRERGRCEPGLRDGVRVGLRSRARRSCRSAAAGSSRSSASAISPRRNRPSVLDRSSRRAPPRAPRPMPPGLPVLRTCVRAPPPRWCQRPLTPPSGQDIQSLGAAEGQRTSRAQPGRPTPGR
jgi:hypothetical protein